MIDDLQTTSPEPIPETPSPAPGFGAPPIKKSNKKIWILAAVIAGVVCLCSVLCIGVLITGAGKIMVERAPIESVLDTFMEDMNAKDIDGAYALLSPRGQKQITRAELEGMTQGNYSVLYDGYMNLSVGNLNLTAAANTNPDLPQGVVANVSGIINFEGNFTGSFSAVLEKVNDEWMIYTMNITVPPDKFPSASPSSDF